MRGRPVWVPDQQRFQAKRLKLQRGFVWHGKQRDAPFPLLEPVRGAVEAYEPGLQAAGGLT